MKPDFFKRFAPDAVFERNLVWDTGMIEIVNASWIQEVTTLPGGSLNVRLKDAKGSDLDVSRDRAREIKSRLLAK